MSTNLWLYTEFALRNPLFLKTFLLMLALWVISHSFQRCLFLVQGGWFSTVLPICLLLQVGFNWVRNVFGESLSCWKNIFTTLLFSQRYCMMNQNLFMFPQHSSSDWFAPHFLHHCLKPSDHDSCQINQTYMSHRLLISDILLPLWKKISKLDSSPHKTFYHIELYGLEHTEI